MRLDKFFTETATLSRSEAVNEIKRGRVKVNNVTITKPEHKVNENIDEVLYNEQIVEYQKYVYLMLNKPLGVVSATEDKVQKTVLDLVPPKYKKMGLFPCGRLDKDTSGFVILTNDGAIAHKWLSPKSHVSKIYYYECAEPLSDEKKQKIEQGITLKDGYTTKPCKIEKQTDILGHITLTEGKYHEVRRMFGSVSNKIISLKRISFGGLKLDPNLKSGEYKELTKQDVDLI